MRVSEKKPKLQCDRIHFVLVVGNSDPNFVADLFTQTKPLARDGLATQSRQ